MMIATGFPAISPSNGPKRSRRLYGWPSEWQGCEDRAVFTVGGDLRLKNKPIGFHFSGTSAGGRGGDFSQPQFRQLHERTFVRLYCAAVRGRGISVMRRA